MKAHLSIACGLFGAVLAFAARASAAPRDAVTPAAPTGRKVPSPTPTPATQYGKGLLVVPTPTPTPTTQYGKVPPRSREVVIGFTGSTPAQSREVRIDFVGKPVSPGGVPRS